MKFVMKERSEVVMASLFKETLLFIIRTLALPDVEYFRLNLHCGENSKVAD